MFKQPEFQPPFLVTLFKLSMVESALERGQLNASNPVIKSARSWRKKRQRQSGWSVWCSVRLGVGWAGSVNSVRSVASIVCLARRIRFAEVIMALSKPSEQGHDRYDPKHFSDYLPLYYSKLFPSSTFYKWLTYGGGKE